MAIFQILHTSFNHIRHLLHSRVRGLLLVSNKIKHTHSDNWFDTEHFHCKVTTVRVQVNSSLRADSYGKFAYCRCMWVEHCFGGETSATALKYGLTSHCLCCTGGSGWIIVPGGFCRAHACMSQVHIGGSTSAPRRGCPWRGFLSVAGLSLIYGGHRGLAEGAGGAWAPSLTQPQVMANYIFISLWSGEQELTYSHDRGLTWIQIINLAGRR